MDYKQIYKNAYNFMEEQIIEEDCGKLCNHHCCRNDEKNGAQIGIYLMPYEYESMLKDTDFIKGLKIEKHRSKYYDISPKVGFLYYLYCDVEKGCLRELRPIQCRTYPFEPHLENDELYLIVENDQIHECPLLDKMEDWRKEFIKGIFLGWQELVKIQKVKDLIYYESQERIGENNIRIKINKKMILGEDQ